ncbi:uncharacterized protein LOC136087081 [Hydra vulgaris]|uniref:Uncharacterized protein LOC136087081 n=1 Tax=Hydra vulgaris TaxID=6087 RepID=A0ABM4CUP3_HYDVU
MSTKKTKAFKEDNILAALTDMKENKISLRKAAFKRGVPVSMLKDRENINNIWLRKADNLASKRAACTPEIIYLYFECVTKQYQKTGITSGSHIWNCDEAGFLGDQGKVTVVCQKGTRCAFKLTGNNEKIHYTVNNCCNADGHFAPPFVIYKAKRNFRPDWAKGSKVGTKYSISKSGWMEHGTFIKWPKEVFIPETEQIGGIHILVLDGHTTHIALKVVLLCKKHNIILICLPEHSSNILQPLDRGGYCHVKQAWKEILTNFQYTGLFPLNKNNINHKALAITQMFNLPSSTLATSAPHTPSCSDTISLSSTAAAAPTPTTHRLLSFSTTSASSFDRYQAYVEHCKTISR